jgi:carbamoyltransferase
LLIWGITALAHDASISVVDNSDIKFAAQSERYSRIKNDRYLNSEIIEDALEYGYPEKIIFFENRLNKKLRQLYAGQWNSIFSTNLSNHLKDLKLESIPIKSVNHHLSHAAAGYYTSNFRDATVVVVDAIGEWETLSVWSAIDSKLEKIYSLKYPNSLGLFYSAMTQRCGLKPDEEEYILMGMSSFEEPIYYHAIINDLIDTKSFDPNDPGFYLNHNLHRGALWWRPEIENKLAIAASVQKIYETQILKIIKWARNNTNSRNLILMGGCALNCVANSKIADSGLFSNIWIMPNPGDAGSSLGAILAYKSDWIEWNNALLGHKIEGKYPVYSASKDLSEGKIIGVASGRAEFGPRALGNRSLLADPRGPDVKNRVNQYKKREQFRPFAPAILEEFVDEYFVMPKNIKSSPYMQYVAKCRYPDKFPAIVHVDNTSRVQTVSQSESPDFYNLISEFYKITGCPMVLNTSLNIKGEPLVNNKRDAEIFANINKITVHIKE